MNIEMTLYNIYWTDCYGKTDKIATTNNLDKWLEENNEQRIADGLEPDELDDFIIEETDTYLYEEENNSKYKIRYRDSMTTYLIDMVFNSKEQAEYYIECNLGESSLYEVETTNHDIETVAEIFFQATDNISSFKGCIEMAETLKEEDPKQFYNLLKGEK